MKADANYRPAATLAPALSLPLIAALFYFVWMSATPFAAVIYFATKVFTLIWPLLAWRLILKRRVLIGMDWRRQARALPLGIASGLLISAFLWFLLNTPIAAIASEAAPAIRVKAQQLGFLENYWLFAIFLSVFHSLIEEYYWRWFVYGRLRELCRTAIALPLASLAFAAHHIVVTSQFFPLGWAIALAAMVGLGGALWCLMFERQHTIFGAWISHMIVDLAVMSAGWHLLGGFR